LASGDCNKKINAVAVGVAEMLTYTYVHSSL
jgi:hypothetical protein